jgi:GNAT superfamily N-acetyltransferase
MESNQIRLCEPSTDLDEAWRRLYEAAFPAGERESEEKLRVRLNEGKLLYHRTLTEQGDLLGFTMVSLASNFSFLAYMATDPARRSAGLGTKHLKRLVELLKEQYPAHVGLFLEIEATDPDTVQITEEERITRKRRLTFYERAGARVVCDQAVYLTPSYSLAGKYWEGDLLCIDFEDRVCKHQVAQVIREIYARFYNLPAKHELVQKVLTEFRQCSGNCKDEAHCCPEGHTLWVVSALHRFAHWISRVFARVRKALS